MLLLPVGGCGGGDAPAARAPDAAQQEAALHAAETYWRSGDFPRAEAILAVLLERVPDSWAAHEMLAQVLIMRSLDEEEAGRAEAARAMREEAWTHLERAVEIHPQAPALHQAAGVLASMLGHSEIALERFERALSLDSANAQAALYAAQMALSLGKVDRARDLAERTLVIEPDDPHAIATLAVVLAGEGRADEAVVRITRAIELAPRDPALRVQQARIMRQIGEPRRAAEILLLLPESQLLQVELADELSALLLEIDEPARAVRVLLRVLEAGADGGSWSLRLRTAEALLATGEFTAASLWARRARQAGAPESDVNDLMRRKEQAAADAKSRPGT